MRSFAFAALLAFAGLLIQAAPAAAQDWWMQVINQTKAQNAGAERPAATRSATRTARAERPAVRATRTADNDDDGSRPQRRTATAPSRQRESLSGGETGIASYYWQPQRLAGGGWFNPNAMTAAHKTLPLGTRVRVTRQDNGNSIEVTINDRGPYVAGRIIDLSRRAAETIGMTGAGLARVQVSVLGR